MSVILLTSCQQKSGVTLPAPPSPTPLPTAATPTADPMPTAVPSPTALAEGWFTQPPTPNPTLTCPQAYPWFFPDPAAECAGTVLNSWAVLQPFEHGLMVWFQEGGRTYIFIDDQSLFKPYVEVADPGTTNLPEDDPAIVPPEGRFQPVRGFAKFWRGLVPGTDWIRPRLGWALAPETAYSALWQCNTATDTTARCYFTGPRDEVIALTRGSATFWAYWQMPVR